ncbi:AAEL012403-PA [Aedes aegypti]|uniref:AAEL012403-PA n=1 Tax=Aedes aegypti TaxID=7159 RepID=Q16M74_AEDAE|nr:AAEL012403-PA [Aedes aegypti]
MFVLKWLFNGKTIYQWIPPERPPFGFTAMGRQINRTFTVNENPMHKHRALALVRPLKNFTGEYTCSVSTFQSLDMRTARMVMIVPETNFVLRYYTNNMSNLVMVLCSVYGISPEPELTLWINEYRLENVTVNTLLTQADLYDSSVSIHLVLYERIQQDDVIKCTLGVKDTDYSKTKETVFIDINREPLAEQNSIFDHISSTTHEPSSSSTESTSYSSTSSTASPSPSIGVHEPTPATTFPSYFTSPTSRFSNEVYKEADAVKHPSAVTVSAPTARVVQHHFAPSLQPAVVRLKPTPPRIFTAGGEHPSSADSDEVTNVVNFKEVFNENMLYSSGASGGKFQSFSKHVRPDNFR